MTTTLPGLAPGADKAALRKAYRAARAREAQANAKAGEALTMRCPSELITGPGTVVAGYAAIHDEIEVGGVLARARDAGATLALPRAEGTGPMTFHAWTFGDPLEDDPMGVPAPLPTADVVRPHVMLMACVAFDHRGVRLGYGAGCYDKTLTALRAEGPPVIAAIAAYEIQRADRLPDEPHDQRADWILTESAAYPVIDPVD